MEETEDISSVDDHLGVDGQRAVRPYSLSRSCECSITTGSIPDDLKMARIVPLYKKNSKTHVGNYRPISVLSVISKVFEKVVFMQLSDYLSENRLLYEFQSGFRSSYSTDTCLIHLTDYIKLENDKGNFTGMVLLDLQKALILSITPYF